MTPINISQDLKDELGQFENFFARMGLKRIEGAIFGLLALSNEQLASEEIEKELNLSQSAVSVALRNMGLLGLIETRDDRESRVKRHSAKSDSLEIVASVFRKREQESISDFKKMAERALIHLQNNHETDGPRVKRLRSIVRTCDVAENVIDFVIEITKRSGEEYYGPIVDNLIEFLKVLKHSGPRPKMTHWKDFLYTGLEKIERRLEERYHGH